MRHAGDSRFLNDVANARLDEAGSVRLAEGASAARYANVAGYVVLRAIDQAKFNAAIRRSGVHVNAAAGKTARVKMIATATPKAATNSLAESVSFEFTNPVA